MNDTNLTTGEIQSLIDLLEKRISVIGDKELRETDPDRQLAELQAVSESIVSAQTELFEKFSPRLRHFFEGCSYDKALDFLRAMK